MTSSDHTLDIGLGRNHDGEEIILRINFLANCCSNVEQLCPEVYSNESKESIPNGFSDVILWLLGGYFRIFAKNCGLYKFIYIWDFIIKYLRIWKMVQRSLKTVSSKLSFGTIESVFRVKL